MSDLIGQRHALNATQEIIKSIEPNSLGRKKYKELVRTIYGNQLKKFTKYNRAQRHKLINDLGIKTEKH